METSVEYDGRCTLVQGADRVRLVWDCLLGSYDPPLYEKIDGYEDYCAKLSRHAITVCVGSDEDPVGAVSLYANDNVRRIGFVTQFAVRSDCRRMGVGMELMWIGEAIARDHGMRELRLEVAEDNDIARCFYSRLGYEVINSHEGAGCILLGKAL